MAIRSAVRGARSVPRTFAITGVRKRSEATLSHVRVDGVVMRHFAFSVCISSERSSTFGGGGNVTRPVVESIV